MKNGGSFHSYVSLPEGRYKWYKWYNPSLIVVDIESDLKKYFPNHVIVHPVGMMDQRRHHEKQWCAHCEVRQHLFSDGLVGGWMMWMTDQLWAGIPLCNYEKIWL